MKKMAMIAAALLVAGFANAAQIVWGNGSSALIRALDGTTKLSASAATAAGFMAQLINVTDGGTVVASSSAISSMSAGVVTGAAVNYTWTDADANDVYKVVLSATFDGTVYTMEITNPAWKIAATDNGGIDTFSWTAGTYGGTTGANPWVAVVPEPTSMALLMLGATIFAFRRKRA